MDYHNHALWQSMHTLPLGHTTASFSARLAQENNWNTEFTGRAIEEYRRFLFLCGVSGEHLTPSETVDEVWHLHLLYTKSYWKDFCGTVLGRELHHHPGGDSESEKQILKNQYEQPLLLYRTWFGEEAPTDIWPRPTNPDIKKAEHSRHNTPLISGKFAVLPVFTAFVVVAFMGAAGLVAAVVISALLGFAALVYFLTTKKKSGRRRRNTGIDYTGAGYTGAAICSTDSDTNCGSDGDSGGDAGGGDGGGSCGSGCGSCGGGGD